MKSLFNERIDHIAEFELGKGQYISRQEAEDGQFIIEERAATIGKILVQLRLERGYTQRELSKALHVAPNTYFGYESGLHEPTVEILIRLADIYDLSLDALVGRDDGETCPGFIYDNIRMEWDDYAKREASGMTIPVSKIRQMNHEEMLTQRKTKKYNRAKKTPKK